MDEFSAMLELFREEQGISKKDLAALAALTPGYVSHLISGTRRTPSEDVVLALANALNLPFEQRARLFQSAGYVVPASSPQFSSSEQLAPDKKLRDWGEAPNIDMFRGRREELQVLQHWVLNDNCRLVLILGIGGVGKTSLAKKLATQVGDHFTAIFWRSLQGDPPLKVFLEKCISFFSQQRRTDLPKEEDEQISLLVTLLREKRCLLILDNFESILQIGNRSGQYLEGYEGYGKLLLRLGETDHQSCLLLTAREKPREIKRLEGKTLPARSMDLKGLAQDDAWEVLQDEGLISKDSATWQNFVQLYSGNPLALKLVSASVRELFGGDISWFLADGEPVFGDVRDLLKIQYHRLSEQERKVMSWLAIEDNGITVDILRNDFVPPISMRALQEALDLLLRRSMIETNGGSFSLLPVIREYINEEFVEEVYQYILNKQYYEPDPLNVLNCFALMKGQARDDTRERQLHRIIEPLKTRLHAASRHAEILQRLQEMLSHLKAVAARNPGYFAGNILNLLLSLNASQTELANFDFSHAVVRQAYLQGKELHNVNFTGADLGFSIFTHTFGGVLSLAISPDGTLLAAGTANGEIRLWRFPAGTPYQSCDGHGDWVSSVAFSPNGQLLASGSYDQTVRIWDVSTGQCLHTLTDFQGWIRALAFSPDGQLLAVGSEDCKVRLWHLDDIHGEPAQIFSDHKGKVYCLAFHPSGQLLASAGEDLSIHLWDIASSQRRALLHKHAGWIQALAFSPDGALLASGSGDRTIGVWHVNSGSCLQVLTGHDDWIQAIAFSLDGSILASGSDDRTVRLWHTNTWECVDILHSHSSRIYGLAFSPQGVLVTGGVDQTICFWEPPEWVRINTLQGHSSRIYSLAFSPDGSILVSGNDDRKVWLWDVTTGQPLTYFAEQGAWIYAVAFSPDGHLLASGSDDQRVRIWQSDDQLIHSNTKKIDTPFKTLEGHKNWILSVTFNPQSTLLATGGYELAIRLWETNTWTCTSVLQGHTGRVRSLAFSPDGRWLASCSEDKTLRIWEVTSGLCLHTLQGHLDSIYTLAFSPDGSLIASGSKDGSIRLWNTSSWQCVRILTGHTNWVWSVAFSPDSSQLASGSEDYTVRLWEVASGSCLNTFHGHTSWVQAVAFHPSIQQHMIASGSHDGTIRLWDAQAPTDPCLRVLSVTKPYDGMCINGAVNLTNAQRSMLKSLGAIDN